MGYLTSLYWHKRELEQAIEQFFLETQEKTTEKKLFDLNFIDLFGGIKSQYFFLHRLYLCALAREQGRVVLGVRQCKNKLLNEEKIANYPVCLSGKWLAVLMIQEGKYESAQIILEWALGGMTNDFTIDFLCLPMRILQQMCLINLKKEPEFSITAEIERLEKLRPGTSVILEKLGIARFTTYSSQWKAYDIALLPPFYYA